MSHGKSRLLGNDALCHCFQVSWGIYLPYPTPLVPLRLLPIVSGIHVPTFPGRRLPSPSHWSLCCQLTASRHAIPPPYQQILREPISRASCTKGGAGDSNPNNLPTLLRLVAFLAHFLPNPSRFPVVWSAKSKPQGCLGAHCSFFWHQGIYISRAPGSYLW